MRVADIDNEVRMQRIDFAPHLFVDSGLGVASPIAEDREAEIIVRGIGSSRAMTASAAARRQRR